MHARCLIPHYSLDFNKYAKVSPGVKTMKTILFLFVGRSAIYYLGLKNMLSAFNTEVFFEDEASIITGNAILDCGPTCICYHILDDTQPDLVSKNLKKLKRLFPKVKIIACLNDITENTISISANEGFNGYFLAEDSANDIYVLVQEVLTTGAGMSKKMAKKYLLLAHKSKIKQRKLRKKMPA